MTGKAEMLLDAYSVKIFRASCETGKGNGQKLG